VVRAIPFNIVFLQERRLDYVVIRDGDLETRVREITVRLVRKSLAAHCEPILSNLVQSHATPSDVSVSNDPQMSAPVSPRRVVVRRAKLAQFQAD
jgi:hypothetical protein